MVLSASRRARLETALGASSMRYCSFGCVVIRVKWCRLILELVGPISDAMVCCQDCCSSLQARLPFVVLVLLMYSHSCLCFSSYYGVVGLLVVKLVWLVGFVVGGCASFGGCWGWVGTFLGFVVMCGVCVGCSVCCRRIVC